MTQKFTKKSHTYTLFPAISFIACADYFIAINTTNYTERKKILL